MKQRLLPIAVLTLALAVTTACADEPAPDPGAPRPVTADESELLATTRFQNFNASVRPFIAHYQSQGVQVQSVGYVDFVDHTGYAVVTPDRLTPALVSFDTSRARAIAAPPEVPSRTITAPPESAAELPAPGETLPPLPPPTALFDGSVKAAQFNLKSRDQAVLALLGRMSDDRPENPLLIRQGGAEWVGQTQIDGEVAQAFTVTETARATYWIHDPGLLLRASVDIGGTNVLFAFGPAEPEDRIPPLSTKGQQ